MGVFLERPGEREKGVFWAAHTQTPFSLSSWTFILESGLDFFTPALKLALVGPCVNNFFTDSFFVQNLHTLPVNMVEVWEITNTYYVIFDVF